MANLRKIVAAPVAVMGLLTLGLGLNDLKDVVQLSREVSQDAEVSGSVARSTVSVILATRIAPERGVPNMPLRPQDDGLPRIASLDKDVVPDAIAPSDANNRFIAILGTANTPKSSGVAEPLRKDIEKQDVARVDPKAEVPQLKALGGAFEPSDFEGPATMKAARTAIRGRDFEKAAAILQSQELVKQPEAEYLLASLYRKGNGVEQSDERAYQLMEDAANAGHLDAQFSLARMLITGRGTDADRGQAQVWLARAAEAGHVGATEALVTLMSQAAQPVAEPVEQKEVEIAASDIASRQGVSPLFEAVKRGQKSIVERMMADAQIIDTRDENGRTPLLVAADNGQTEIVKLLLDNGARADATDADGYNALMRAAANGRTEVVMALAADLKLNATRDSAGHNAGDLAFLGGHCDAGVQLLSDGVSNDVENAIIENCPAAVLAAVSDSGHEFQSDDGRGRGPIWMAAKAGNAEALKFFLDIGFEVEASETSPLLVAINGAHEDAARLLIERGANIEAKTSSGNTATILAASRGLKDIMDLLLSKGADIDQRNEHGYTALMLAAQFGREEIVVDLIENGADTGLRNTKREQANDIAEAAGFPQIAELLQKG